MTSNVFKFISLTSIVLITFSCKKEKVTDIDPIKWTSFRVSDGLLNDNIHTIAIDNTEKIWVGSDLCLSAYDGSKWTNYTNIFPWHEEIFAIAIDKQSNKWIGSRGGGVAKFDDVSYSYYAHDAASSTIA
ncbi:MAG: hypothetical protein WKG06_16590 [Segetibacter sp.]